MYGLWEEKERRKKKGGEEEKCKRKNVWKVGREGEDEILWGFVFYRCLCGVVKIIFK